MQLYFVFNHGLLFMLMGGGTLVNVGLYVGFIFYRCLQFICFDCVIYSGDVSMKGNGLVNFVIVGFAVILCF